MLRGRNTTRQTCGCQIRGWVSHTGKSQVVGTPDGSRWLWLPPMPHTPCALAPERFQLYRTNSEPTVSSTRVSTAAYYEIKPPPSLLLNRSFQQGRGQRWAAMAHAFLCQELGRRPLRLLNMAHKALSMFREQARLHRELKKKKWKRLGDGWAEDSAELYHQGEGRQ